MSESAVNAVDVDRDAIASELAELAADAAPAEPAAQGADQAATAPGVDWDQALAAAVEMFARVVAPNWELEEGEKQVLATQGAAVLNAFFPNFQIEQKWVVLGFFAITAGGIVMKRYDDEAGAFKPLRKSKPKRREEEPAAEPEQARRAPPSSSNTHSAVPAAPLSRVPG